MAIEHKLFNKIPKNYPLFSIRHQQIPKGFTLIELLITIAILGIAAAIIITAVLVYLSRGRDAKRKSDLQAVKASLEGYFKNNRVYPAGLCPDFSNTVLVGCTNLRTALVNGGYIKALPDDPKNVPPHVYIYAGSASDYVLMASLENLNDKDCPTTPCAATNNYQIGPE